MAKEEGSGVSAVTVVQKNHNQKETLLTGSPIYNEAGEIEKVMREEMGDDYNTQKASLLYGSNRNMGEHI